MSTSSATSSGPAGFAVAVRDGRPGTLPGEGDEAADGALLLAGEGAAGAVGDGAEQVGDRGRVVGFGGPGAQRRQPFGEGEPVLLARRALPARLDGEEPRTPAAAASRSTSSASTIRPAEPSPLPASRIAS